MTGAPEVVRELPPSAKLVYTVLEHEGELTQQQLVEETLLPARTVRDALSRLQDADIVEEHFYIPDARMSTYSLAEDAAPEATSGNPT